MDPEHKAEDQGMESQEYQSSSYSSEDEDGVLLTDKVEQKILTTVAKLRNKDPEIYNIKKPIFEDEDFEKQNVDSTSNKKKNEKYTYKDLVTNKNNQQAEESDEQGDQKKDMNLEEIKASFKNKLAKNEVSEDQDLFKIKKKVQAPKKTEDEKLKQFVSGFDSQSSKLLKNYWENDSKLDKTDLFLRNYIINQRWKTSKMKENEILLNNEKQQMIDEQDQQRSVEMDEYEANYNFRYQQPGADKIAIFPRQIPQSMRIKPDTRKQKRKKLAERKKNEQEQIRKQYEQKKAEKKEKILQKLQEQKQGQQMEKEEDNSSDFDHDWFFCDDCAKALEEKQEYYVCYECGEYMLCEECHELIIHKHQMQRAVIPIGAGPPPSQKAAKALKKLKSCKGCRKKIPHYLKHYQYSDRASQMLNILCQKCYDESNLDTKKKFKPIEPSPASINYQQLLDTNPQKIKQLNTQKDIEELVDQYIKCDFEDVIGGGLKTKFKYINVKPESYGLSDQQILYGDDKELNKYVSIKKLGAYEDEELKLRNNMYNRKIKGINKSAQQNKKLLNRIGGNAQALRVMKKIQTRSQLLKKRRESRNQKLKIINISNPEDEKKLLLPKSRLASYGLAVENTGEDQQQHGQGQGQGQRQRKGNK